MWLILNLENPTYRLFVLSEVAHTAFCGKMRACNSTRLALMPCIDKLNLQAGNGSVNN